MTFINCTTSCVITILWQRVSVPAIHGQRIPSFMTDTRSYIDLQSFYISYSSNAVSRSPVQVVLPHPYQPQSLSTHHLMSDQ